MKLKWLLVVAVLLPMASAFPLTGGTGDVNITIFGVIQGGDYGDNKMLVLDCFYPGSISISYPFITLIDSEDRYYDPLDMAYDFSVSRGYDRNNRMPVVFVIPPDAVIKRIKIRPAEGSPFFVEWTGVPEVKNDNFSMKFYSATEENSKAANSVEHRLYTKELTVELKVTNEGSTNTVVDEEDFYAVDQFGWEYPASGHYEEELLPGEAMRFSVTFDGVSVLSRLVTFGYRPEGLSMDISAWT